MKEVGILIAVFGLLCLILPVGILLVTQPRLIETPEFNLYFYDATLKNGTSVEGYVMCYPNMTASDAVHYLWATGNFSSVGIGYYG